MVKKTLAVAWFAAVAWPASAELSTADKAIFHQQIQQIRKHEQTGQFRVIDKPATRVVQESEQAAVSPFALQIEQVSQQLQQEQPDLTPADAEELAKKQVADQVVEQKDKWRAGGYINNDKGLSLGTNICAEQDGVTTCLGEQNPVDQGKRPSRGQVQWFMLDDQWDQSLLQLPMSGKVAEENQPWSDDYWAIYKGILGHRYQGDSGFGWEGGVNYVLSRLGHLSSLVGQGKFSELSPSEKYDLLIGKEDDTSPTAESYKAWLSWVSPLEDSQDGYAKHMDLHGIVAGYLTPGNWQQGQYYFDSRDEVERWMGICHGWATAAVQLPRPVKSVTVTAADGVTELKFYPADIKALGSYLWAQSAPRSRFIGGRCNDKEAQTDEQSGALVAEDCFDTNPADWHLVVANYLNIYKHSFVMDATFDYEVWNQPVVAYELEYFDVADPEKTSSEPKNIPELAKKYKEWEEKDPFSKVRTPSAETEFIIGVNMTVDYVVETSPSADETDSPERDRIRRAYYTYDLELDKDLKPVGGEWWHNQHPDFLWSHDPGAKAISRAEATSNFSYDTLRKAASQAFANGKALHPSVRQLARTAAERDQVLGSVVEALFDAAKKDD